MTAIELNNHIKDGTFDELVRVAEARQVKALSKIADKICETKGVRVVLLAGCSSAGKTTTAKRLCTQLRVNDREALLISTDDYFVGDSRNPRDENGKLDYESVHCVDIPLLTGDIRQLISGQKIPKRVFDFVNHEPGKPNGELELAKDGLIVIEGIHALNPILTEDIEDRQKFRVFVEPKPSIMVFAGIVPTSEDARFLRRMIRDNRFRKMGPERTLELWPNVLRGEEKWIRPFAPTADATFNSYLEYEMAVLSPYVGGLLAKLRHDGLANDQVEREITFLQHITPTAPITVPGDSIVRETIGGSQLEY